MAGSTLVGRAPECARLDRLVDERGAAIALVGEPGIGKTALLEYARGRAGRVLSATGAEAEADLPFAGLLSLLRPVLHHVDRLPPVQRRALEGALAIGPPAPSDRLGVHAAALGLLSAAAEQEPVLAVVDDAHWLDEASADALLFAARRLDGEPLAFLLALRPIEGRWLDLAGIERMPVEGLGCAEAKELLCGLPGAVVERLHAATAGNPLALLEARSHVPPEQLAGRDPLGDPLPVGPGVQAAFRRRLDRLPPSTRLATVLVAAAGAEPLARIAEAGAVLGISLEDLVPAEADQLVDLAPDHVRFRHPLVRAAAYHDAPASDRRSVHAALAAHTEGARRASHLWAAATGPDAEAAATLEAAAAEAHRRTGYAAAALANERAARLTERGDARAARLFAAARDRMTAGDAPRAVALAHEAEAQATDLVLRAEIRGLVGAVDVLAGSVEDGARACSEAAEMLAGTAPDRAAAMLGSAAMAWGMAGQGPRAHEIATRAHALAQHGNASIAVMLAFTSLHCGADPAGAQTLLDRWPETIDASVLAPGAYPVITAMHALTLTERYEEAEAFAAGVEALVVEAGAIGALPQLRSGQVELDLRRGDWARARARASEAQRVTAETGQVVLSCWPIALLARVEAAMGLEDACRASCAAARESAVSAGVHSMTVYADAALGLLELGLGRVDRAVKHLEQAHQRCLEYGHRDPSAVQYHSDLVEAHIRAGALEVARAALAHFEELAERTQRRWALATVARCHGMLETDFEPWFERAYAAHGPDMSPFEIGRTELVHGERLRRARRVREARERLRSALGHFEALGSALWATRARTELRAAGGAVGPPREPASRELTPQQLEVALAVVRGATNREVAAALFLSPKTVEVHLTRIFKKLGVRSRTELAALLHK